ncbi:phosphate/phosphite/phosphonate ABC transporter substrate-binding protein [Parachitinimonas caeni]|uniref:Phosphate/phosphite/phosphonate ABC transporter substrate-binding protein n=1 Tax=Parachitinimonas caeni TaxID=3031301 RepID=A0ABT7DTY4_9NEIS|nr:phosphate/phosphite/phosphonate ABC transporter substrate-binding protein [Parachitinimonas caeni]MDK2123434.1 phosphate/phosphite/phosphonate ABC transporter substrate-binding protein [Parachitinimonas caeni]
MKLTTGLLVATALFATAGTALASETKEISVGLIVTTSEAETLKNWQPFLDDMSKKLGMKVTGYASKNYSDIIDGMKQGKVQVAWLGAKSALQAVVEANGEVFVRHIKADGSKGYSALLLTHNGSGIASLDQVISSPGKYSYANGKPTSTSGFLLPNYYVFTKNEIDPKKHFKSIVTGSHQDNFLAVAAGKVDIATNNTDDFDDFKNKYPSEYAKVKVLWKSEPVGLDPMLYDKRLPADTKQKLARFFIDYGKGGVEERKNLLQAYDLKGFERSTNMQLKRIADLEMFNEQYSLMVDDSVTAEQKDKRFREINQKYREIQRLLGSG